MQQIARSRGGECLSRSYETNKTPLRWRCKNGHVWDAPYARIKRSWCARCAFDRAMLTVADCQALAKKRRGRFASKSYLGSAEKRNWVCVQGHRFRMEPRDVGSGHWCPACAGVARITLRDAQAAARKRGGICLARALSNGYTKVSWKCAEGHVWETTVLGVRSGRWCPYCSHRVKRTIEEMRSYARSKNGACLSLAYRDNKTALTWKCNKGHIWKAKPNYVLMGRWCPECAGNRPLTIVEMQAIAGSRGGECLSKVYRNSASHLRWKCVEGHTWVAIPSAVKKGSWCPTCARKRG
jgi:hypothetical protein